LEGREGLAAFGEVEVAFDHELKFAESVHLITEYKQNSLKKFNL
jgi:hypothetical protein